jgi:hypothetical protein
MAKIFGSLQLIRPTFLFVVLTSAFAMSLYSQSNAPDPTPAEPNPRVSENSQESKQPAPVDTAAVPSSPASSSELRQAQIETDTKKLFQLAADLRAEVAKTYKDSLSLSVIKKAEEVEKLAKSLKVLMNKEAATARH